MKKILQFKMMRSLLLIVIAVMGFSSSGWADPLSSDGILYTVDGSNNASIVGISTSKTDIYNQSSTFIELPLKIENHYVTSIAAKAFDGCANLDTLVIESTSIVIEDNAFNGANIQKLYLSATTVPTGTGNLSSTCAVYIPKDAYNNYSATTSLWKDYNLVAYLPIGTEITFAKNDLKYQVTDYVHNTVGISGVKTDELTYYLNNDPTITYNADGYVPTTTYKVTSILTGAFTTATSLKSLIIPSNIKEIKENAFSKANNLKYMMFDGGLPVLSGNILGTNKLNQIIINGTITTLPTGFNPGNLPLAYMAKGQSYFISLSNSTTDLVSKLNDEGYNNIKATTDKLAYDIKEFNNVKYWVQLDEASLGTTTIMVYDLICPAVQSGSLKTVSLPTGSRITSIGTECFKGYKDIASVTLNTDLVSIGSDAFAINTTTSQKLSKMSIPASVKNIYAPIFDSNSIPDTLVMLSSTPPSILSNYTSSMAPVMTSKYLMVPSGSTSAYQEFKGNNGTEAETIWGQYPTKANVIEEEFTSGDFIYTYVDATKKALSIKKVVDASKAKASFIIPYNVNGVTVTTLAADAFSETTATNVFVQLPGGITTINSAFTSTSTAQFRLYFLGSGVTTFTGTEKTMSLVPTKADYSKFTGTEAGQFSIAKSGCRTAGEATGGYFYAEPYWYEETTSTDADATKHASIQIPNELTSDSYTIPETAKDVSGTSFPVYQIGYNAFQNCTSTKFTEITVPATVTSLEPYALANTSLKKIHLKHTKVIPSVETTSPFVTGSTVALYVEKGTKGMTGGYGTSGWAGIANEYIIENGAAGSRFTVGDYNYFVIADSTKEHGYHLQITSPVDSTKTYYSIPTTVMYNGSKYIVTSISDGNNADESFTKATKAITFILPDSIQSVFANAFSSSVKYIVLPKGLTTFESQPNLKNVKFYTEATAPADGWNIKANEITIPTGVSKAYTDKGFTKAYVLGDENSIYSEGGVWYQVYSATNTQAAAINPVDMGSKDLTIATKIIKDNFIVDKIAEKAFSNSALTSIKLGDSLKIIGDSAFWFTYITKISLPASVDSIGSSALRTSSTSGSTLALTDITANNDTPCKWHAGDNYLPTNGVKLHVSSTTVKNAYMSKGWEGYTSTYESLIIPTKDETLVSDLVKGSDVTIVDGSNFHIGTSSVNYGYTSNTFAGYSPRNITIMDAVTTLTLSKDTVSGTVTVSNDKSDKIGLVLNIANSSFGNFTNNDTVQIAIDSQSKLGTITNNGVLVEESGVINKIDAGKTQMSVAGDINKSFPGNSSTKIFASATVLKGSAKADSVQFVWQLKDAKSVYQTIAKGTHYALAKKSGLRAAATKTLIDSLTVTEGGDYRCLITDFDSTKTAYATLGVYGTVTMSTPKTVGTITLKKFKKGYYEGVSYGKDTTFVFTKDTEFEFQIMDTFKTLITNYAVVTATYKSTGEKDTLKADGRYYYRILHTTDTITVSVDSCIITANEPISLTNNVKVWGNDGILHVSAPQRVTVYIATFDGRMRAVKSEAGDQEFYLGKGIYIIRIEDKTWKIKI